MQKKYVLPLLMVTPAVAQVMEAINLDVPAADSWSFSGVTGGDMTIDGDLISAPLGGTITNTVKALPKGNYKLVTLAGTVNAAVSVNGKAITDGRFTLDAKGDAVITVVAADNSQAFSFGIQTLELVFDFEAAKQALNTQLGKVDAVAELRDPATKLTEERAALLKEAADIAAAIEAIGEGSVKIYEENGFDSDNDTYTGNKIAKEITAYAEQVKAFNEKVAPENEAYDIKVANEATIKGFNDGIAELNKLIGEITASLENVAESDLAFRNNATLTQLSIDTKALEASVKALEGSTTLLDPTKDGDPSKACADTLAQLTENAGKLAEAIANDKADDVAYKAYTAEILNLTGKHAEAVEAIDNITGELKDTDVFADKKTEWKNQLSDIVAEAKDKAGIGTEIEGAAGKLDAAKAAVADALTGLQNVVDDANAFADALNDIYNTALEAVAALNTSLNETIDGVNVPASFKAEYDGKVKAVIDAISAMRQDIDNHYKATDLTAETYAKADADIKAAIEDLKQYIDDCAPIIAAQASIDQLKKNLDEAIPENEFVKGKFKQNIDAINDGIATLQGKLDEAKPGDTPVIDTTDIQAAIDLLKESAAKLTDIVEKVGDFDKAFKAEIDKVNAYKDKLERLEGNPNTWEKFIAADPYKTLKAAYDKFTTDYAAARATDTTPEECYNLFIALDLTYDYAAQCAATIAAYCNSVATGNFAVAEKKLDGVKKAQADGEYPGKDTVVFTEIDATMTTLATEAGNVNDDKTAATCTSDIKKAMEAMDELQATVDALKANHKAYTDLTGLTGDNSFTAALDKAKAANADISVAPATKHYDDEIAKLQGEYDKLVAAIDKAHDEDFSMCEANADQKDKKNHEVFQAQLDSLIKAANDMPAAIRANHEALQAAIKAGESTRATINDLIASVEGYIDNGVDHEGHDFVGDKADTVETLREILRSIDNLNAEAATAYGKGQAAEGNFTALFDELAKTAAQTVADFETKYGDNVVAHNKEVKAELWDALYEVLENTYTSSVKAFDNYNGLKNPGYKAAVQPVLTTNEGLFDYSKQIRDLKTEVEAWFTATITRPTDETQESKFAPIADDNAELAAFRQTANNYIAEMKSKAEKLKADVDAVAEDYYATLSGRTETAIQDADAKMNAAGITDETAVMTGTGLAKASFNDAAKLKADAKNIGIDMDAIATMLDSALGQINLQNAAIIQWNANYKGATEKIAQLKKELAGYEFATAETKEAAETAISDATTGAEALNNDALAESELVNSLSGYTTELDKLLADAEAAVAAAKQTHDNDVTNKNLYEGYINDAADFDKQLEELRAYVDGFAGNYSPAVNNASEAVATFKAKVEELKNTLADNSAYIGNLKTLAQTSIDNAYISARNAETEAINTQLSRVKVAYNNAKVNPESGIDADRLVAIDNEIHDIMALINGKAAEGDNEAIEALAQLGNKEFKARAGEIESQLDALEAELDKAAIDAARAALDELAAEVINKIEAGKTFLGECEESVQDKYAGSYDNLTTKVENLKAQWQEGNSVLSQQDNLTRQLNGIAGEVDALQAEIAAADQAAKAEAEKIATSNARYDELIKEYDELIAAINAFKDRLDRFGYTAQYESSLEYIDETVARAKAAIDEAKEKHSLTAESTLLPDSTIPDWLENSTLSVTDSYFRDKYNRDVITSLNAIPEALADLPADKRIIPSKLDEIHNKHAELEERANTIVESYNNDAIEKTVETLDGFIEESDNIINEAKALLDTISESTFLAGDVDEDNEVTVADAQSVLNWVGTQASFDELFAASERKATAADIDGNEALNIGDVTAVVNIAMGYKPSEVRFAMGRSTANGGGSIFAELLSEEGGVSRYAVTMLNNNDFAAGQFDLTLPAGSSIRNITIGERAISHELHTFDNNGTTRVILASMENAEIEGSNGAVVYVEVEGEGNLTVEDAIFATKAARTYKLLGTGGNGTSMIDSIRENLREVKETIYNAAGQTLNRLQRGVNIIRKSDGTVTKEIRK